MIPDDEENSEDLGELDTDEFDALRLNSGPEEITSYEMNPRTNHIKKIGFV